MKEIKYHDNLWSLNVDSVVTFVEATSAQSPEDRKEMDTWRNCEKMVQSSERGKGLYEQEVVKIRWKSE